ncbi:hypothetical protein [Sulfitobacter litoralis]|uniref:hypothetical protein n=1 Tax=Sulfitobacter litoralis TaxID=335975 RepID=UPI002357565F|nr:hypothetical protein [Sulfitobacter litoralis]
MSKPQQPDTSVDDNADIGYDPSLIKVHDTPPYSTDHVEHGRPHPGQNEDPVEP